MKSPQFELHADIEQRHWWFRGRRTIMREIIGHVLPPSKGHTILDVGCGTGGNIGALAGEFSCVGIDTSPEAIELAKTLHPEVQFLCGVLRPDEGGVAGRAKLFLLMDVLEHVSDDFLLFSETLSMSRPGSYLLITVPADMALWSKHDESFGHYRRYDRNRLSLLWQGLPVSVSLLSYYNARLYPIIWLTRTITRLRGRPFGRAGTDFRIPSPPMNALLEKLFANETGTLVGLLEGRRSRGFSRGASLIALLRREPGDFSPRRRPDDCPPDPFQPGQTHDH